MYTHTHTYKSSIALHQFCSLVTSLFTLTESLYLIDEEIETEAGIHLSLSHIAIKWLSGDF